jgi:hypothetical protein
MKRHFSEWHNLPAVAGHSVSSLPFRNLLSCDLWPALGWPLAHHKFSFQGPLQELAPRGYALLRAKVRYGPNRAYFCLNLQLIEHSE